MVPTPWNSWWWRKIALELAAPRIRVLPPQAMLAHLEHRLTFLTGGAPDLPARQRIMRETIAWSYDLLNPAEQKRAVDEVIPQGAAIAVWNPIFGLRSEGDLTILPYDRGDVSTASEELLRYVGDRSIARHLLCPPVTFGETGIKRW